MHATASLGQYVKLGLFVVGFVIVSSGFILAAGP